MNSDKIYHKLTIERCRMNLAQLCAATHFYNEKNSRPFERETIHTLIAQIDRDIRLLDEVISEKA